MTTTTTSHERIFGETVRLGYLIEEGGQDTIDTAIAALERAGCDRVIVDSASQNRLRPSGAFLAFVQRMSPGDTLVVTELRQLARNTSGLIERIADLVERGIKLDTLSGELDTDDTAIARIFMTLATFDAAVRQTRRQANPNSSNAGRPRRLSDEDVEKARQMIESEHQPIGDVAYQLGISRATLYRALRRG